MKIEVPEQVVVLDPNLSQNNAKFATMVEKYKEHHHQKGGNVKMNEVLNIKKDKMKKAKNSEKSQHGKKRKHVEEDHMGGDQDMMAMMGFGGFGGSKKN